MNTGFAKRRLDLQNGLFVTAKILSQLDLDVISGGLIVRC